MVALVIQFFAKYSLAALVLGTFFEGETILVAAGVLVSQDKLEAVTVWLLAATGAWLGHLFWFLLGRWIGSRAILHRFPRWEKGLQKADAVIQRNPWLAIFILQYMYGMRIVGALAVGFSSLRLGWFALAEAVNCLIWAAVVGGVGYAIGQSALHLIEWSTEAFLIAAILLVLAWAGRRLWHRRPLP